MNILNDILDAQDGRIVQQIASQFGLKQDDVRNAVASMLPALSEGLKKNASRSQQDADDLLSALGGGSHSRYVDEPGALSEQNAKEEGNNILGHILGSKDVSRKVAGQASAKTGINPETLKGMLPVLAAVVMGALSKRTSGGSSGLDSLTSLIDLDGDGSVADDMLDFARKLF